MIYTHYIIQLIKSNKSIMNSITCNITGNTNNLTQLELYNIITNNTDKIRFTYHNDTITLHIDGLINMIEQIPLVIIHHICDYLIDDDINTLNILSKKFNNMIFKYKSKHYDFFTRYIRETDLNYFYNKYNVGSLVLDKIGWLNITDTMSFNNVFELELDYDFNLPINNLDKIFPNLRILIFNNKFNQPINSLKNVLQTLEKLIIGSGFDSDISELTDQKFTKLVDLVWCGNSGSIDSIIKCTPNLKYLSLCHGFGRPLDNIFDQDLVCLESLIFGDNFCRPIYCLANKFINLKNLQFGDNFDGDIDCLANSFPNLESLVFGEGFSEPLDNLKNSFPKLKELKFGLFFNQPLDCFTGKLTELTSLKLGVDFSHSYELFRYSFPNLLKLTLMTPSNKQLNDLINCFPNLVKFKLKHYDESLACLANNFPKLKTLILDDVQSSLDCFENSFPELEYLEVDRTYDKNLYHFKARKNLVMKYI